MPQTLYFNIMLILLAILERGGSLTVELGNGNEESLKPANGQKKKKNHQNQTWNLNLTL